MNPRCLSFSPRCGGLAAALSALCMLLVPGRSDSQVSPPVITDVTLSNFTPTSAQVSITVAPDGDSTSAWLEYGTDTSYGTLIGSGSDSTSEGELNVTVTLNGLTQGTVYHLRAIATNSAGTASHSANTCANCVSASA